MGTPVAMPTFFAGGFLRGQIRKFYLMDFMKLINLFMGFINVGQFLLQIQKIPA